MDISKLVQLLIPFRDGYKSDIDGLDNITRFINMLVDAKFNRGLDSAVNKKTYMHLANDKDLLSENLDLIILKEWIYNNVIEQAVNSPEYELVEKKIKLNRAHVMELEKAIYSKYEKKLTNEVLVNLIALRNLVLKYDHFSINILVMKNELDIENLTWNIESRSDIKEVIEKATKQYSDDAKKLNDYFKLLDFSDNSFFKKISNSNVYQFSINSETIYEFPIKGASFLLSGNQSYVFKNYSSTNKLNTLYAQVGEVLGANPVLKERIDSAEKKMIESMDKGEIPSLPVKIGAGPVFLPIFTRFIQNDVPWGVFLKLDSDLVQYLYGSSHSKDIKLGVFIHTVYSELLKFQVHSNTEENETNFLQYNSGVSGYTLTTHETDWKIKPEYALYEQNLGSKMIKFKERSEKLGIFLGEEYFKLMDELLSEIKLKESEINKSLKNILIDKHLIDESRSLKNFLTFVPMSKDNLIAGGTDYEKLAIGNPMYMLAYMLSDPFAHHFMVNNNAPIDFVADIAINAYYNGLESGGHLKDGNSKEKIISGLKSIYKMHSLFISGYNAIAYAYEKNILNQNDYIEIKTKNGIFRIDDMEYAKGWQNSLNKLYLPDDLKKYNPLKIKIFEIDETGSQLGGLVPSPKFGYCLPVAFVGDGA